MSSITVSDGTVLYYEDSGIPVGAVNYTTIFLIHGLVFHSPIFRPTFPHAAAHNLRLIAITVPGYPGSSALTDAQAASLTSDNYDEKAGAIFGLSQTIARGIAQLIRTECLPPPQNSMGLVSGGVRILAWSAGNSLLLSLLANLNNLDKDVNAILEQYVIGVIFYELPSVMIGEMKPADAYSPLEDPNIPPSEIVGRFNTWISAYFEPLHDLDAITPAAITDRKDLTEAFPGTAYTPVSGRMSFDELQSSTYPEAAARNPMPMPDPVTLQVYAHNFRRAVLDTKGAWPRAGVHVLWGDMSPCYFPWAARAIQQALDKPAEKGEQRRKVQIVKMENANHFLHWEDPERMVHILNVKEDAKSYPRDAVTKVTSPSVEEPKALRWAKLFKSLKFVHTP